MANRRRPVARAEAGHANRPVSAAVRTHILGLRGNGSPAILVTAITGLVAWLVNGRRSRVGPTPPVSQIRSVAVLPLENLSGDPNQEYFADGMTEQLIC